MGEKLTLPQADVTVLDFSFTPFVIPSNSSARPHVQFLHAFFLPLPGPHGAKSRYIAL